MKPSSPRNAEAEPLLSSPLPVIESDVQGYNGSYLTRNQKGRIGVFLQMLGALIFAIGDVAIRYVQTLQAISSEKILFCISFSNFAWALLYLTVFGPLPAVFAAFRRKDFVMLGLRGLVGSISLFAIVSAFKYLPSGDVITLLFSGPIFLIFLSHFLLGEPITKPDVFAAFIGFIGVVIVSRPDGETGQTIISAHDRIVGTAFALSSAVGTCFVYITMRKLVTSVHFMTSSLALGSSALVVASLLGGFVTWEDVQTEQHTLALALCAGFVVFLGQTCVSYGIQFCNAGTALLLRNLEVLFVYILGLAFLHEFPTALRALGAVLVVSGTLIVSVAQVLREKRSLGIRS